MQLFQWGVIILFVLLHFALGYFRGAAKSGYFTLVNIILSFIILWIVSGVSVANSLPQADLIAQIEANLSGSVSAELLAYLTRTEVITLLYGLVDVFVRIVTFLVLYTVVRWFISFVGFGLLYKYVLEKHVQKVFKVESVTFTTEKDKENNDAETIKDPVIHAKVIKKSTDRLIGGAFGAVRGFITAIFLLLPLVVLASTTNNLNFEDGGDVFGEDDIYELIEPLQVTPVFAGLQNGLFDWAFETELTETQNFNLRDELNNVTAIVQRAYEAGYLSEDFDINTLGSDDVEAVQDILGLVGDSGVLIAFLEVGSDLAADGLLEELIGLELSNGAATQAALAELADIDWKLELAALGIIFEKLTAVGTIEEITALSEDTNNLTSLTEAEVTALADVLRAVADLQLIKVANVGLEYVLELEDVQANIEWLPVAEREAYLKEVLAEVLNDTEFFYGENGDLYNIADLLEVVLSQYGSFSVAQLLEEDALDALLTEDGEDFLNATLDEVTQVEIVSALLPTAVDFALYSAFDADVAAELDEALNETVNNLDFDAEFDTFGQIFGALVTLTANELLAGNEDVIEFVDRVAQNNLPTVRLLVGYVFDDSVLVNAALNEAAPVLLDAFVEDQDTKDLLETLLFDENGLTINLGQEFNTLLDVLEDVYGFATLQNILDITSGEANAVAFLDDVLANEDDLASLRSALNTLLSESQLIEQVGNNFEDVLPFVVEDADTQTLLLTLLADNAGALALDLAAEVDTLLDILVVTSEFTTLEGLLSATEGLDLRGSANLGYAFGSLTPTEFGTLIAALKDLQLLGALDQDNTESLLTFLGVENVYVPASFDAAREVEFLFNLVYGLSVYLHENMELGLTPIEDVDFTELLLSDALAGLLLIQEGTLNSQLLVPNLAYSIESALIEAGLDETIIVPEVLLASSPESAAWAAEYNVLVTLLLTVAELASNYYELSFWGIEDALASTGGELADTLALVDSILGPNVGTLKLVVGGIVANSQILVATADHTLNTLVEPILGTEVSINVIQEILTLLDVVEVGYKFTSLEGLYTISQDLSLENLAAAGNAFGGLSAADATTVVQKLTSLQLVEALDRSLFLEALNNLGAANVVVPEDFDAAYELGVVLNLVYATAHYVHLELKEVTDARGIDFGPLLTSAAFENFMVAEEGNTYSKVLVANFKQLMLMLEDMPALRLYFDVPASLEAQFATGVAWTAEYNRLVKFVIAFVGALNQNIELSNVTLTNLLENNFRELSLDTIDPFNDPVVFNQTFGVLDDSEIFRASALKLFELGQLIVENVYGYELELPANIIENGTLKNNAFQALLKPLISILVDVKDASGLETVRDLFLERTAEEVAEFAGLVRAVDPADVALLAESEIVLGVVSNFLTSSLNRNLLANAVNDFTVTLFEASLDIDGRFFDFTSPKYGLFTFSNEYDMFIMNANDLEALILAGLRIDFSENQYTLDLLGLNDFIEVLDLVGTDGKTNLEFILESDFIVAVADKVINVSYQPYSVLDTVIEIARAFVAIDSDLLNNVPLESSLFVLSDNALDANKVLLASELLTLRDIADVFLNSNGLFTFNTLDDLYAAGELDVLFDSHILMSYASNAIQNEALQAYAIEVANDRQDIATVPSTFVELDAALLDANGFVLVSELEALADVVYVLGLMDIDTVRQMMTDLVESPSITTALGLLRGYAVTDDFENQRIDVILNSNIVYTVIAQYLDNENLDDVVLPFLPDALVDLFGNVDLGVPSDLKADEGFSVEYISRAELKALLTAVTYVPVDPTALDGNVFNFITDLIGENVNSDTNEDDLDRFLASGYLREKLSRLFLSEAVLDLFGESPESFNLPSDSFVVVDGQRRLTAEELRNLVEAFAVLEITTIDELNFSFAVFTALTPAERETVLESAYLYAVVDGLIQNQQSVAIPNEVLAVTGEITQEEILAVIEAVELLDITDVTSLQAVITGLDANDVNDAAILQLLEDLDSGIIDSLLALLP